MARRPRMGGGPRVARGDRGGAGRAAGLEDPMRPERAPPTDQFPPGDSVHPDREAWAGLSEEEQNRRRYLLAERVSLWDLALVTLSLGATAAVSAEAVLLTQELGDRARLVHLLNLAGTSTMLGLLLAWTWDRPRGTALRLPLLLPLGTVGATALLLLIALPREPLIPLPLCGGGALAGAA